MGNTAQLNGIAGLKQAGDVVGEYIFEQNIK